LQSKEKVIRRSTLKPISHPGKHPSLLAETIQDVSSKSPAESVEETRPILTSSPQISHHSQGLLGNEIKRYIRTSQPRPQRFLLMIIGLMAVLLPLFVGVRQFQRLEYSHGYYVALQRSQIWIFLSIFAVIAFFLLVASRTRHSQDFIALHQNGIRFKLNNKRICWLLFQNITGLHEEIIQEHFLFITIREQYLVYIHPKHEKNIRITNSISNLPEFYANLAKQVNPILKKKIDTLLLAGEWIDFGKISLNHTQLRYHSQAIMLDQIQSVTIRTGKLMIIGKPDISTSRPNEQPTRANIPLPDVFNLDLLLNFLETRIQP